MDWLISQQDRSQLPPHPRECVWGPENPVPLSLLSGLTRVASEPHRANVVLPEGGLKEAWSWACIYKSYIVLGRWWCASFTSYRFMMFINIITSLGKASTNEINTALFYSRWDQINLSEALRNRLCSILWVLNAFQSRDLSLNNH